MSENGIANNETQPAREGGAVSVTTQPTREDEIKAYGQVYRALNDVMGEFHGKSVIQLYSLISRLRQEGNILYLKCGKAFSTGFYEEMAGVSIKWFWDGVGLGKSDVTAFFQKLWKYHKKYLLPESTNEEFWKELCNEGVAIAENGQMPGQAKHYISLIIGEVEKWRMKNEEAS